MALHVPVVNPWFSVMMVMMVTINGGGGGGGGDGIESWRADWVDMKRRVARRR